MGTLNALISIGIVTAGLLILLAGWWMGRKFERFVQKG